MSTEEEIERLHYLLLNEYEHSLFFAETGHTPYGYDAPKESFGVFNVRDLWHLGKNISMVGIKKVYVISKSTIRSIEDVEFYLKIKPEIIKCYIGDFIEKYPMFICNGFDPDERVLRSSFFLTKQYRNIGYTITPYLSVGPSFDFSKVPEWEIAKSLDLITKDETKHIINVSMSNIEDYDVPMIREFLKETGIKIHNIPISEENFNSRDAVYQVADLIHELTSNKEKVYIHCYMGQNRSITCTMMYLIKYHGKTLKDAFLECCLRKRVFLQDHFIDMLYDEALKKEENPIAKVKLQYKVPVGGIKVGFSFEGKSLGGYHVHMLDIIAGRKANQI